MSFINGPKIGDPATAVQSAQPDDLNRELARVQEENARLKDALLSTPFGKEAAFLLKIVGRSAVEQYAATMREAGEIDAANAWERVCAALAPDGRERTDALVTCSGCGQSVANWKPHVCSALIKESFNDY